MQEMIWKKKYKETMRLKLQIINIWTINGESMLQICKSVFPLKGTATVKSIQNNVLEKEILNK